MVVLKEVTKVYPNRVVALDGVSLSIARGEFVFVVGPSGAGKSTLVRLLYREEVPTSGQVWVDQKDVARLRPGAVPYFRRSIGVVFQDFKLLRNKTAAENVAFALEVTGASRREIRRRVPHVLDLVGLAHKARAYPHQLSGGEQQRVSLARALVNNPVLLLADEPTGNLDPDTSWEIMQLLDEANRRGTTVIMATHARHIVNAMKKRVIALRRGRVVRDEVEGRYAQAGDAVDRMLEASHRAVGLS